MRCPEARSFLHPFLDGELEPGPRADVQQHLDLCPPCRERFEGERRLLRKLRDSLGEPCPDALKMKLRVALAIAGAGAGAPGGRRVLTWPGLVAAAAAVIFAFVYTDPVCLRGCDTVRALTVEHHALMSRPPADPASIQSQIAFSADAHHVVEGCCKGKCWSVVNCEVTTNRCKRGCVVRLMDETKRCVSYVALEGAHIHPWLTLGRGNDTVVVSQDGCFFAGWKEPDGSLCGVVADEKDMPRADLVALARTIRARE
jgi:hypothetical protein